MTKVDDIVRPARELGRLLRELVPAHAKTVQSFEPDGSLPAVAVRLLEHVGASEVTLGVVAREDAWSAVRTVFEEWFEDAATRDRWGGCLEARLAVRTSALQIFDSSSRRRS